MKPDQIKRVAEAAKASGLRILEHYLPGGKEHGKEYKLRNPHRDDKHVGSLSIEIASGKGGDFAAGEVWRDYVGVVAFAMRIKPGEAAEELARFLGLDTAAAVPSAPTSKPAPKWRPVAPVPDTAPPPPAAHKTLGKPDSIEPYFDDAGRLLCFVCRWDATDTRKKEFRPLTWCVDSAGRGEWQWIGLEVPRPLFGLDLMAQRPDAAIVICEGEKATKAARTLLSGYVVTCWLNGAAGADKADFSPCKGRTVLLWRDHDEPGTKAMQTAAKALRKADAAVVKIINMELFTANTVNAQGQIVPRLADLPAGWDAADALAEGWTPAALAELLAREGALLNAGTFVSAGTSANAENSVDANDRIPADTGPYQLDRELGLFYIETDKEGKVRQTRICAAIEAIAFARDGEGGAWSLVLEFRDRDGQLRREVIPVRLFLGEGHDGVKQLADMGLEIASGRQALDRLKAYIVGAHPERRALLVDTMGWHGRAFMQPEGAIGETDEVLLLRGNRRPAAMFASRGKLTDWQGYITHPAIGNPRLMFSLAAGFAGPLLKPLGMQGAAFHWTGDSSTGKTAALQAAASIWGPPDEQVHSWRSTANALEYTCAMHNDMTMVNDELRELDAKEAGAVAYMQGNGKGKGRAHHAGGLREPVSWRIVMLSSGELGLADHIASAGQKHFSGQEVRFVELDADGGAGLGMWNDVAACAGGGKQLSDNLKKFAARYHGTAGRAFVRELIKHLDMLPTWWRSHEAAFAEHYRPADAGGQVLRVMTAFCLVGFAGELAARFEVVPWERGAALSAAGRLFTEWLHARPTAGNSEEGKIVAHVRGIMERNWQSRFVDWRRASGTDRVNDRDELGDFGPDLSRMSAVHDALGFRKPDVPFNTDNPHYLFYVTRARFAEELATKGGFKPKRVAAVLKKHGALRCDDDGTTWRETLPNGDSRSYCIIGQKLWALDL